MAVPVLSMQFDSVGCTNRTVKNLGGVSFNSPSCIGKKDLRSAYFPPYHSSAGFEVTNDEVRALIESGKAWSLYFKYKTKQANESSLPILTYREKEEWNTKPLITVENGKSIVIKASKYSMYFTRNINYSFDGKWHTFYLMYDEEHTIRLMIDGQLVMEVYEADIFDFAKRFYIGYSIVDGEVTTLNGWHIDDFNIFKGCLYEDEFIPPTEYVSGSDVLSNYHDNSVANVDNLEEELVASIEKNREHSAWFLNEMQKGWLPRRAKFNWHEDNRGYFVNHSYERISKTNTYTHVNVEGLDQPILTGNEQYYEATLETALDAGRVLPMLLFVNGKFRRLSQTRIVKSDDYYCFIFMDRNRFKEEPITSFEVIILPFPVVYEEDYGERADQSPLYTFNREGYFDPINGHTFYYVDQERAPTLKHIGIRENIFPNDAYLKTKTESEKEDLINRSYMKFSWRYGKLDIKRLSDDGKGAFMTFQSDDYSWIKPGDSVMLYNGTVLIDQSLYEIVGYDLLYFEDIEKAGLKDGRTVTMQVVTDSQNPKDQMLFQDLTEMKAVTITAAINNQSVFKIPEVSDGDGIEWRKFLLFKGHVLMENDKRYTIDYDAGTIQLNDPKDFMPKGRNLLFTFLKVRKANSRGNLYVKPIVMYARPTSSRTAVLPIEEEYVKPTKSNVMVFRNSTFISPYRYQISGRELVMNEDELPFDSNTSLIFVMLKMVSPYDDPTQWRESMMAREMEKGQRFILYDLGISKKIKITLDNFLCWDEEGKLITDLRGKVYELNIIKRLSTFEPLERKVRYLTCLYRTDHLEYEGTSLLPFNDTFMREYIKGRQEYYEMDAHFDQLMEEFNFRHSMDRTYGENLSKSLNYILGYNQNKLDDVYDRLATASRRLYNTTGLNNSMKRVGEGQWQLAIPRDDYKENRSRTYSLFFQDGRLATSWYKNMKEVGNDLVVILPSKMPASAKIESIDFHGISNFLIPLDNVVKSDKIATIELPVHMVTGYEHSKEFDSSITIKESFKIEVPARIDVPAGFTYIYARNEMYIDAFTARISVRRDYEHWFNARIEIEDEPHGIEVDLDRFNSTYGFFSRVEVQANEEANKE